MLNQYEPLEQPGVALSMPEYPTSSEIHEVISKEKYSHLSDIDCEEELTKDLNKTRKLIRLNYYLEFQANQVVCQVFYDNLYFCHFDFSLYISILQMKYFIHPFQKELSGMSYRLLLLIIVFYLIVVIAFFIALGTSQHFRQFLFDFFSDNYENDVYGLLYIGAFEFVLIITGFDIFLMDILFGFFIRPYLTALSLLFATKMAGKFLCFALVKYCFKEEIYQAFKGNIFFKTFYVAAQINPIKILAILQLITLPTAFKTYVVGVFAVSTPQYLVVTSISNFLWTGFWVHVGVQAKNVKTFIETGKSSDIMPLQVQLIIFFGGICALGYLLKLTNQVYQSIVQEVQGLEKDRK